VDDQAANQKANPLMKGKKKKKKKKKEKKKITGSGTVELQSWLF
jgi:hypothetical protein